MCWCLGEFIYLNSHNHRIQKERSEETDSAQIRAAGQEWIQAAKPLL